MCGIAGLFDLRKESRERDPAATALAMADALAHRGPDGRDSWGDRELGVGLGHRRLAIIDLSSGGAQPMHSVAGRYVITYNGEVYNFQELRTELTARGHNFLSTSDTEVMLAAFMEWGPDQAVERFVGMFAFAVFDRVTETLRLVRDRLGVKPMYWTIADGTLLFGSELRALMAHPSFRKEADREAIAAVLRCCYVPGPATGFRNVFKLPPGTILTVGKGGEPIVAPYWRLQGLAEKRGSLRLSFDEATARLDALLRDAVRGRMIADVPVGAFLSGGADSTTVVAMMQAVSNRPARTVTIGFADATYDEARHAREVAAHLGTDHTEVTLEPKAALDLVNDIAGWFDEPFADSSQLPTYLVSSITRQHVKVALSGDGGDELFAGYPKYLWLDRVWAATRHLPRPLRAALGCAAMALPERALRRVAAALLDPARAERIGEKARRLGAALGSRGGDDAALALAAVGLGGDSLVIGAQGALHPPLPPDPDGRLPDLVSRMQIADMAGFLPDDSHQGRSLLDGGRTRGPRAAARSPPGRVPVVAAARNPSRRRGLQGSAARGSGASRAARADRSAEAGLQLSAGGLAARTAARLGRRTAVAGRTSAGGVARSRTDRAALDASSCRCRGQRDRLVERADGPGLVQAVAVRLDRGAPRADFRPRRFGAMPPRRPDGADIRRPGWRSPAFATPSKPANAIG
jgi:asparagine synthase (glutamine-hydrolysing)